MFFLICGFFFFLVQESTQFRWNKDIQFFCSFMSIFMKSKKILILKTPCTIRALIYHILLMKTEKKIKSVLNTMGGGGGYITVLYFFKGMGGTIFDEFGGGGGYILSVMLGTIFFFKSGAAPSPCWNGNPVVVGILAEWAWRGLWGFFYSLSLSHKDFLDIRLYLLFLSFIMFYLSLSGKKKLATSGLLQMI